MKKPVPEKPAERIRDMSRLTDDDEVLIWRLHQAGKTQVQIAQIVECDQSTVSRALRKLDDTRDLAKTRLHNEALSLVSSAVDGAKRAAKDGKPEAALELLDREEVATRRQSDSGRSVGVSIYLGQPGQAAGPAPVIDLSPLALSAPVPSSPLSLNAGEAVSD